MDTFWWDSNAFIQPWRMRYPIEVFPGLWEQTDGLIQLGRIKSVLEVYREIRKQQDELYRWVKPRKYMFVPEDVELSEAVVEILSIPRFGRMVEEGRNGADPWVIAAARVHGGIVVCDEGHSRNPLKKPKMPDVCDHFGVPIITHLEFIRRTGWRF